MLQWSKFWERTALSDTSLLYPPVVLHVEGSTSRLTFPPLKNRKTRAPKLHSLASAEKVREILPAFRKPQSTWSPKS